MITTTEQLKKERPDLVELFEGMSHKQLLEQIYKEVQDGLNMEERVEVFMSLCAPNMSKTTYTPDAIKELVEEKERQDTRVFCKMMLEDIDGMDVEEIKKYLQDEIIE